MNCLDKPFSHCPPNLSYQVNQPLLVECFKVSGAGLCCDYLTDAFASTLVPQFPIDVQVVSISYQCLDGSIVSVNGVTSPVTVSDDTQASNELTSQLGAILDSLGVSYISSFVFFDSGVGIGYRVQAQPTQLCLPLVGMTTLVDGELISHGIQEVNNCTDILPLDGQIIYKVTLIDCVQWLAENGNSLCLFGDVTPCPDEVENIPFIDIVDEVTSVGFVRHYQYYKGQLLGYYDTDYNGLPYAVIGTVAHCC